MDHGLSKSNILLTLPVSLQGDSSVTALADAVAALLASRPSEIDLLRIYPDIWRLDGAVLDILARDFKVDWWDPNYTVEQKRQTLHDSFLVHRRLGTKWAVETAISAIYPHTKAVEWYEYGGEPYHFRLDINITDDTINSEKQKRVLDRLNYYKNLRSHNDGITYFVEAQPAVVQTMPASMCLAENVCAELALTIPKIQPAVPVLAGGTTALWESQVSMLALDTPVVRPSMTARVGAVVCPVTVFHTALALPTPVTASSMSARAGVTVGRAEGFTAAIDAMTDDPKSAVRAISGGTAAEMQEITRTALNIG